MPDDIVDSAGRMRGRTRDPLGPHHGATKSNDPSNSKPRITNYAVNTRLYLRTLSRPQLQPKTDDKDNMDNPPGGGLLSQQPDLVMPLEQEVLDEYERLADNMNKVSLPFPVSSVWEMTR